MMRKHFQDHEGQVVKLPNLRTVSNHFFIIIFFWGGGGGEGEGGMLFLTACRYFWNISIHQKPSSNHPFADKSFELFYEYVSTSMNFNNHAETG